MFNFDNVIIKFKDAGIEKKLLKHDKLTILSTNIQTNLN